MNLKDFREDVFRFIGTNDTTLRRDFLTQQVKDDINRGMDDIYMSAPYLWHMVRESTIAVVANTATYNLNDYCIKPLSMWTQDAYAHKVKFTGPRDMDRSGLRNSSLSGTASLGPWDVTWYPPTTTAGKTGASGAAAGVTLTEANTTITKSGGTAWVTGDTGSVIKFNGEDEDYIFTYVGANSGTIDKPYISRLLGTGTSGTGTVPALARWEMVPKGTYRVQFVPTPGADKTVYYRYVARPRRLIGLDDTPELPGQFHYLISYAAIMRTNKYLENPQAHAMYQEGFASGIRRLVEEDRMEMDEESQAHYESPIRRTSYGRYFPKDMYSRT